MAETELLPIKGQGFEPIGGGFASIFIGDRQFTADEVRCALLRRPPPKTGEVSEPVAWMTKAGLAAWLASDDAEMHVLLRNGNDMRAPLYTHPVAAEAVIEAATHRHKRFGSEYLLIGIGKMQTDNWADAKAIADALLGAGDPPYSIDMREVAIYRSVDDGSLWVRPREEFEERFEALALPSSQEAGK